jgi:chaperonin GroES
MNQSGIRPIGNRVLIRPDEVEKVTAGGIVIPDTIGDTHALAQSIGVLVDKGPDAWVDYVERDSQGQIVRYGDSKGRTPQLGDRVAFEKYGGIQMPGLDGNQYRLIRAEGISAVVEEGVDFTDLHARKPVHKE